MLADIKEKAIDYSVLGIDEGQFVSLAFFSKIVCSMQVNNVNLFREFETIINCYSYPFHSFQTL